MSYTFLFHKCRQTHNFLYGFHEVNFYLILRPDFSFLLQNRAQAATELLQELNSDVSGNFVEEVGTGIWFWHGATIILFQ